MEVGAAVWVKDNVEAWIPGVVQERRSKKDKFEVVVSTEGDERRIDVLEGETETDDIKPRDTENNVGSAVKDLIQLPVLHEPAILQALELRYDDGFIYTFNGAILIAVNPFQRLPLYTETILETYYNHGLLKSQGIEQHDLDPHVYTVADAAYRDMATGISMGTDASQSILISGESGAGKTETTKIVMRYLTVVGAGAETTTNSTEEATVMDRVLDSNPILEAFGNARTVRNDNSSRFGKYIELNFDARGSMRGAAVETYLLEKIRLPRHADGERNFHIFYQLHAATTYRGDDEKPNVRDAVDLVDAGNTWTLNESPGTYYHYANQGGILELAHLDDAAEFAKLVTAFQTLGFADDDKKAALRLTAALLHLGDVSFDFDAGDDGGGSKVIQTDEVQLAASLAALPAQDVIAALTTRVVKTRTEEYVVRLVPDDASNARDALAKALYGRLFDWLVENINTGIAGVSTPEEEEETNKKKKKKNNVVAATIGVLDIFGFECFVVNSFEQLCINYTNETLQQQFNRYVFKLEQEEYAREAIKWSFIEFPDNQDCLDLIEGGRRQMPPDGGLLVMLDDECRLPRGSDANYAARVARSLKVKTQRIQISKKQAVDGIFEVWHYAGPVPYQTRGFLEKNKDELPRAAEQLFVDARQTKEGHLLGAICDASANAAARAAAAAKKTSATTTDVTDPRGAAAKETVKGTGGVLTTLTVAAQFKSQLASLIHAVAKTKPHYIRCLKPNDKNVPKAFWRARVAEQLRYGGVLEAVRVARSGFPVRMPHGEFASHYAVVGKPAVNGVDIKTHCEQMIVRAAEDCNFDVQEAQLGKTKVFLRKHAHDQLEGRRAAARVAAATRLTSIARTYLSSSSLARRLKGAKLVLRVVRGFLGRSIAYHRRRRKAATLLVTTLARGAVKRRSYQRLRFGSVALAALARGVKGRSVALQLRLHNAAARINRTCGRGLPQRQHYRRCRHGVIRFQTKVRRLMAREALRRRKAEMRDVGKLRQEKEAMKEEILRLKQQAATAALEREAAANKAKAEEVAQLKAAMERDKAAAIQAQKDAEVKARDDLLAVKDKADAELDALRVALERETAARVQAEQDLAVVSVERDGATKEVEELQTQLQQAQAVVVAAQAEAEKAKADVAASLKQQKLLEQQSSQLQQQRPPSLEISSPLAPPAPVAATQQRRIPSVDLSQQQQQQQQQQTPVASSPQAPATPTPAATVVDDEKDEVIAKLQLDLDRERAARADAEAALKDEKADAALREEKAAEALREERSKFAAREERTLKEQQKNEEAEQFREKLKTGIAVAIWDGDVLGDHVSLALEGDQLTFAPRSRSLFRRTKPPPPVAVHDMKIRPGHSSILEDQDDSRFLTLLVDDGQQRRDVVVQFHSDDAKHDALLGLKHLLDETPPAPSETPKPSPKAEPAPAPPPAVVGPQMAVPQAVPPPPSPPQPQQQPPYDDAVAELEKQLLLERANNHRMMLQMLEMQNDVNRSSAKIVELKQESAGLRSQLVARDRMHADDARMRLQLGKRLQQLVFDNAALRRETDDLQAQLAR